MAIAVFPVYKRIVVDKILIACIVRRIDIYHVYLALVSIGKSRERFEVVTLDKDMVGRIGRLAHDGAFGHFGKDGKLIHKTCFYFFRLVLPHQAILLLRAQKFNKRSLLFVCQSFELRYLFREFIFIHILRLVIFYHLRSAGLPRVYHFACKNIKII